LREGGLHFLLRRRSERVTRHDKQQPDRDRSGKKLREEEEECEGEERDHSSVYFSSSSTHPPSNPDITDEFFLRSPSETEETPQPRLNQGTLRRRVVVI